VRKFEVYVEVAATRQEHRPDFQSSLSQHLEDLGQYRQALELEIRGNRRTARIKALDDGVVSSLRKARLPTATDARRPGV
jgi:hypothetical protein